MNLLLLLIPDHLVGKEAFLLGEIMMSFCGGRRQIIRLETTNSTLLNGLLFVLNIKFFRPILNSSIQKFPVYTIKDEAGAGRYVFQSNSQHK